MNDLYYDTYMEGEDEAPEPSPFKKIMKIVWKTVVILLLCTMFFLLFYRIFEMKEPKNVGKLLWTNELASAQKTPLSDVLNEKYKNGTVSFERETLTHVVLSYKTEEGSTETLEIPRNEYYKSEQFKVFTYRPKSYYALNDKGTPDDKSDDQSELVSLSEFYNVKGSPAEGKLRVTHLYLVPMAKEVQLTFRYKKDILDTDQLNGNPFSDDQMFFHFSLEDDASHTYDHYRYELQKKGVYRYVTLIFDGVNLLTPEELKLNIFYINHKNKQDSLRMTIYDGSLEGEQFVTKVEEKDYAEEPLKTSFFKYPLSPVQNNTTILLKRKDLS